MIETSSTPLGELIANIERRSALYMNNSQQILEKLEIVANTGNANSLPKVRTSIKHSKS